MTPIRHAQYSHLPPSEDSHGRQAYLHPFLPTYETSSFLCSGFLSPCQGGSRESDDHRRSHQPQQEVDQQFPCSGSTNYSSLPTTTPAPTKDDDSSNKNDTGESDPSSSASIKWMSSKMRFMKKMMNSDRIDISKPRRSSQLVLQDQVQQSAGGSISNGNNHNHCLPTGAPVRVCSDCNTTKTPLWRSGPRGPKSLCNACGIRQRKARRAMAAAAVTAGGLNPAVAPAKLPKEKKQHGECAIPFKKRCKFTTAETGKPLHVDEFTISFGKNSAFQRVFPQDEKEAAMLLMALSCGFIRG